MPVAKRERIPISGGTELSFVTAGAVSDPPILLIHGFPSSARSFRGVIPKLSKTARVIAPDLPGFGESPPLRAPSFDALGKAVSELLESLSIGPRYIYLHDFGAPVGLDIAMKAPDQVLGLIIQNANVHESGMGPGWQATKAYWSNPSAENAAKATAHLTYEGTRDQYIANVPKDLAERIPAESWEEDWRVMQLPGRMDTQRALIADYGNYAASFHKVHAYLKRHQPPALMLWGRHDGFFELAEIVSWMEDLPRMESRILDGAHFLLETHAYEAATRIADFITRTRSRPQ